MNRKALETSRRTMLAGMAALPLTDGLPDAIAKPISRPNILWIVSEDNNPYIGAYGDTLAKTPTIDSLARSGVLFRNAFSNAPVCAPSRFAILTGVYPESCAPANQMRAKAKLPSEFKTYPELMRQAGYFCSNNAKTDYNCDVDPAAIWDVSGSEAHWRKRPAGKPFLSVFNLETTHESKIFAKVDGAITPQMVKVPPFLPDTPGVREDFATYYNLMERMDGQVAKILDALKADKLDQDTIVFYYSDNGGVLGRSKRYCYDEGLHCAMVVHAPPKWQHLLPAEPGKSYDPPVSFIDLAPTVLALAGQTQPAQMNGRPLLGRNTRPAAYAFGMRNRMDERIDFIRTVTDGRWRYIRNYMPHRPWGQYQAFEWQARNYQDWLAAYQAGSLNAVQGRFFQTKPYEELYDLRNDRDEIRNLAHDASAKPHLHRMRKVLDAHMMQITDNGFLPETMQGEGYFESRQKTVYPLARIMPLAAMAAKGDPANLPALVASLKSKEAVMRYWAATGLLILGSKARPALSAIQQTMRSDPEPFVRIVAAEAEAGLSKSGEAVNLLASMLDGNAPWQRKLHAINSLTFIDPVQTATARASIDRAALADQEYIRNAGRYLSAVLAGSFRPNSAIFDIEHMAKKAR